MTHPDDCTLNYASGCLRSPILCTSSSLFPQTPPRVQRFLKSSPSSLHLPPLPQRGRHEGPTPQRGSPEVTGSLWYPCGSKNHGCPSLRPCVVLSLSAVRSHCQRRQCRRRWARKSSDGVCPIWTSCWDRDHHHRCLDFPHPQTTPWLSAVRGSQTPRFHLSKHEKDFVRSVKI